MSYVTPQSDGFDWTIEQQSMIFGAFYWFAWASELSGGILSHKYGSKITFGLTNFIGCLLCSAIPVAAYISWKMVVVVRVLQGTIAVIDPNLLFRHHFEFILEKSSG